jgi:2-polyprenyl-3-methyl-5-hydroxy-6-metoxy-1,4-benzoquinol methylase
MLRATFEVESRVEATHWWFVARRELFAREIARAGIPLSARVLDIGTSTGTNLRMLKDLGFRDVTGLDATEEAIRFCAEKAWARSGRVTYAGCPSPTAASTWSSPPTSSSTSTMTCRR